MAFAVIAYPFEIWSAGIEAILRENGWEVSGSWPDTESALEAIESTGADLLILSRSLIELPASGAPSKPLGGLYAGKIIIVLERDEDFSAKEFAGLDVEGLVLSSASREELSECIDHVGNGRQWVDPGIRHLLSDEQMSMPDWGGLSGRELEVAQLAAQGLSNKDIARHLRISGGTVKMHMHHILSKLRLGSRIDLAWSHPEFTSRPEAKRPRRKSWLASRQAIHPPIAAE